MRKLTTPTVLAFERNLDISDAVFTQFNSQDKNPVEEEVKIREKSVRGTISNRLKNTITNDPTKLDAEIQKTNLQRVDVATLNDKNDILVARFTCKVLPFDGKPCVCNDQDYQSKIIGVVESYIKTQGFSELAKRYATNIANARWLWRNRMSAETIKIEVSFNGETLTFDNAKALSLNTFDDSSTQLQVLTGHIEDGLSGKHFVILNITAYVKMGYGQEVYPSQELVLDAGANNRKSKVLYKLDDSGKAAMHSQKVSNAIRTIDTWYKSNAEFPIATEPYGAVTTLGTAFRQPKEKLDFYTLFDNWLLNDKVPDVEQQHYVMSVLIRGGVFGASGKE
ncbi:type I-F CRISPR-associated protein Csy3 [Aggregatibacter actinomycetemcomitans]|uniref:type I-F CRISPR-associated protein Csy3 n=1 Tax=Aggregatibacter actinomycetemcomitans TaxID=714 RepID=UPI0006A70D3E|nr:type I-F CRISPR-associated protein Csy3 [Aggregatibacter actinomycetemcomitans]KOE62889.1 CRISPR-associated protein Cas5 [Aggregatibacter actinomycetemcomitans serotype e str. A160]KOE65705.1 CRISPR-associated protein Cas5 [Aggregatibacter actinomycetemcomitans serotype e str. SCC393]KYK79352.1 CRISPR-associated protein Cas5 [Aggregatibacter actinomycetemcomitans serotype e str. SA2876]